MAPLVMPMLLALRAGLLIDGAGRPPLPQPTILMRQGRVAGVYGAGYTPPAEARVIDYPDATVLPGLIDCHLHLIGHGTIPTHEWGAAGRDALVERAAGHAEAALRAGVTTIRDCGAPDNVVGEIWWDIGAGRRRGPHLLNAGRVVTTPGGHGHFMGLEASGPAALTAAVEALVAEGVDFIKLIASGGGGTPGTFPVHSQYTTEEVRAVVEAAHAAGRRVAAHAHSVEAIRCCVEGGVDSVEHVTYITAEGPRFDAELARRLADSDTWVIPTMACYANPVRAGLNKLFIRKIGLQDQEWLDMHASFVRAMHALGVKIAAGTDGVQVGVGPADVHDEARYIADAVGSPAFGICAATGLAAEALGIAADRGTVETGRRGDLLLVRGNPLDDMRRLRDTVAVFKDGMQVPPPPPAPPPSQGAGSRRP